jgi:HAD superfamily hydrolase (TIGR01509 family)
VIKAVIFDMDGVLIDARDWHYEALNKALALFGFEIQREEHLSTFDGLPTSRKLEIISETKGLPMGLHRIINKLKQDFTTEITLLRCRPQFQHEFALAALKKQGIKVAVASNSISDTVHLMMRKSNLLQYLDFYLSNEDVVNPKPSPEIYLKAIEKLELTPNEVLIVEDNDHGVAAAIATGAHLMRVADPSEVSLQAIDSFISKLNGDHIA